MLARHSSKCRNLQQDLQTPWSKLTRASGLISSAHMDGLWMPRAHVIKARCTVSSHQAPWQDRPRLHCEYRTPSKCLRCINHMLLLAPAPSSTASTVQLTDSESNWLILEFAYIFSKATTETRAVILADLPSPIVTRSLLCPWSPMTTAAIDLTH